MVNLDKVAGSMLGAVLGDVLGWPFEQNSKNIACNTTNTRGEVTAWKKRSMAPYNAHIEQIDKGSYSDDTQLILAISRSRLKGDGWASYFSKFELPFWLSYERGGGGATKRSARSWRSGIQPWKSKKGSYGYYNAGGNGAAMRILPHSFFDNDLNTLLKTIFLDVTMTHGHPRAIIGALLYGQALKYLLDLDNELKYGELINYLNKNREWSVIPDSDFAKSWLNRANESTQGKYNDLWDEVVTEVVGYLNIVSTSISRGAFDSLSETLTDLGCFKKGRNGAGTITAISVIYIVSKRVVKPLKGLCEVAYLKNADTDTLASMVGGLFGALYGTSWLNEYRNDLQDYEYIYELSEKMANREIDSDNKEFEFWTDKDEKLLKNQMKMKNSFIKIKNFGEITLEKFTEFETSSNKSIGQLKYTTLFSQSLYFTLIEKNLKTEKTNKYVQSTKTVEGNILSVSEGCITIKNIHEILEVIPPKITAKRFLNEILEIHKDKNNGIKFDDISFLKKKNANDIEVYKKIYNLL